MEALEETVELQIQLTTSQPPLIDDEKFFAERVEESVGFQADFQVTVLILHLLLQISSA